MLVRTARGGGPRRVILFWRRSAARLTIALLAASLATSGCLDRGNATPAVNVTWTLSPASPTVGPATLSVTVRDAAGTPVKDATIRLEGHMSHAGMTPVFANATERTPGVYDLAFAFTMPGDWVLLVNAALPDGTRVERRIDVAKVQPNRP
jgi:hypothetical protein